MENTTYSITSQNSSELVKQLEAEKNLIVAEFTQSLENLRNRAVVRMLETSERIIQDYKAKEQAVIVREPVEQKQVNSKLIDITNDQKEKSQSWEASVTTRTSLPMSICDINLVGYGDSEEEAVANLNLGFQNLIKSITE